MDKCLTCAARPLCLDYPESQKSGIPIQECRYFEDKPKERFETSDKVKELLMQPPFIPWDMT
jgi:hypothetical protein